MPLEAQFKKLMSATITVEPFLSYDQWMNKTYGPPAQYQAWVMPWPRRWSDKNSDYDAEITQVIVDAQAQIGMRDRLTLPDGKIVPIIMMEQFWDEKGPHHLQLMTGFASKTTGK